MISLIYWLVRRELPVWSLAAAMTLGLFALAVPGLLWPFNRIWTATFAKLLSFLMTRITLLVMFFGILSPIAILMRIFGRDNLALKKRGQESYFVPVETDTTAESLVEVF